MFQKKFAVSSVYPECTHELSFYKPVGISFQSHVNWDEIKRFACLIMEEDVTNVNEATQSLYEAMLTSMCISISNLEHRGPKFTPGSFGTGLFETNLIDESVDVMYEFATNYSAMDVVHQAAKSPFIRILISDLIMAMASFIVTGQQEKQGFPTTYPLVYDVSGNVNHVIRLSLLVDENDVKVNPYAF